MTRENLRIKLLRMVSGQVRSYVADHPDAIHPHFLGTIHNSLSKRIAHELVAKGLVFDQRAISAIRRHEDLVAGRAASSDRPSTSSFKVEHKRRRKWRH